MRGKRGSLTATFSGSKKLHIFQLYFWVESGPSASLREKLNIPICKSANYD